MTYIEFFEKTASENICSCLTSTPDRVIFIGDSSKTMKTHIENYKKVFSGRGQNIEFLYKTVSKNKTEEVVNLLTELVNTYDDSVFDITGGDELFTFALGIVYERNKNKNIKINKTNFLNNSVYDCDNDGYTIFENIPQLSVDENVCIYGGNVVYGDINDVNTYNWDLNDKFTDDAKLMWRICKSNPKHWNTIISIFGAMESVGKISADRLTITADVNSLGTYSFIADDKHKMTWDIVDILQQKGLVTYFDVNERKITVAFKNQQVRKCLTKAGQALEMKVFLTAQDLTDECGAPVYNDVKNGVVIDWDGKQNDEFDTENEIDVLMMHNMIPVFVSCKNGRVTVDELYKLNTVAQRFGGKYAKKALVITGEISLLDSGKHLIQRAEDMDIKIIENVQELSETKLADKISNLWCN